MGHLVTANVRSRLARTSIITLAVALRVTILLLVGGIASGSLKATPNANVSQLFGDLRQRFPGLALARATASSLLLTDARVPFFDEFRAFLIAILMLLSFMVALLAMYMTVFERTHEIGVLKSRGSLLQFYSCHDVKGICYDI